ncbi:MAG: IS66 family insertion sequence element accessory protein TnpB [Eubacteriales bacterium]|nr:IS66 family insertion sequence element accessory protein TnpB [Eubacteriales bacterium]
MDPTTMEVRKAQWAQIINACQARPVGTTVKQWLLDNEIPEKRYYYWQRKLREDAYEMLQEKNALPAVAQKEAPVEFAEIPFAHPDEESVNYQKSCPHPVTAIQMHNVQILFSNDLSPELLRCILQEVGNA